jgi:hypothetical protein
MVEQRPFKALVAGSSPAQPITMIFEHSVAAFCVSIVGSQDRFEGRRAAELLATSLFMTGLGVQTCATQSERTLLLVFCIDTACSDR